MKTIHHAMILSPLLFALGCAVTPDDAQESTSQDDELSPFSITGSNCFDKLCANFTAAGGKVTVVVEDISRTTYNNVTIEVACSHISGASCPAPQTVNVGSVAGAQKKSHTFLAPPTNVYTIGVAGSIGSTVNGFIFPSFEVNP